MLYNHNEHNQKRGHASDNVPDISDPYQTIDLLKKQLDKTATLLELTRTEYDTLVNSLTWRLSNIFRQWLERNRFTRSIIRLIQARFTRHEDSHHTRKWIAENGSIDHCRSVHFSGEVESIQTCPSICIFLVLQNAIDSSSLHSIDSVIRQTYTYWQLYIVQSAQFAKEQAHLEAHTRRDSRVRIAYQDKGLSIAHVLNSVLDQTDAEFITFLSPQDEMAPQSLLCMTRCLDHYPDAAVIYSDEDMIDASGTRSNPICKSAWNPDLLFAKNYIGHLLMISTGVARKAGGFRPEFDGAHEFDILLRCSSIVKSPQVVHIPEILYHQRSNKGSVPSIQTSGRPATDTSAVVQDFIDRSGLSAKATPGKVANTCRVEFLLSHKPKTSVIIPTRDRVELLRECISGVLHKTDYNNLEILIVDNRSNEKNTLTYLRKVKDHQRVKVIPYDKEFNFSAINNLAVQHASGEVLLFLNNDISIIDPGWLSEMVGHAMRPEIGCVGAKLYYPDSRIQHAGIFLGYGSISGHRFRLFPGNSPGYLDGLVCTQNVMAVTGACLAVRRNVFDEVSGFDERLKVTLNDVDFCLKAHALGYRNVFTPWAELIHHESITRGHDDTPEKQGRYRKEVEYTVAKWGHLLLNDPFYNPNLTLTAENLALADHPRRRKPRTCDTRSTTDIGLTHARGG